MATMQTFYARHTKMLDIDDAFRNRLWEEKLVAIHYPDHQDGSRESPDNESLDPEKYPQRQKQVIRALVELAQEGGYVCAEYYNQTGSVNKCRIGRIEPGTEIEFQKGRWGSKDRTAVLKAVRLKDDQELSPSQYATVLVGRPRQGTLMRWKRVGNRIKNLVEGCVPLPTLANLLPPEQEVLCCEFLRLPEAKTAGLPQLAHLLLPIGRTMRGVDIVGMTDQGDMLFAQVTYLDLDASTKKLETLNAYKGNGVHLVLFCKTSEVKRQDGVTIYPIERVLSSFVATEQGRKWLECVLCPSGGNIP